MVMARISTKGQITLPAAARRALGLMPKSKVEVEVRKDEIVIRRAKTIRDMAGIFHEYAKGKTDDWETVRRLTEEAVAREVMDEDGR